MTGAAEPGTPLFALSRGCRFQNLATCDRRPSYLFPRVSRSRGSSDWELVPFSNYFTPTTVIFRDRFYNLTSATRDTSENNGTGIRAATKRSTLIVMRKSIIRFYRVEIINRTVDEGLRACVFKYVRDEIAKTLRMPFYSRYHRTRIVIAFAVP